MSGRSMGVFGPMAASMKKARPEGPVFGEVRAGIGSRGSSGCAPVEESPEQKGAAGETVLVRSHSVRGMRDALCLSVTLPLQYFWESHDPHRVRASITNRQTLWCRELEWLSCSGNARSGGGRRTEAPQAGPRPAHPRPRSPILRVDTEPSILAEIFGASYSGPGTSRDPARCESRIPRNLSDQHDPNDPTC